MKTILVLNMGMKSIRSIIFDSCGNKIASAALPLKTSLSNDYVTQDADEWWEKANEVMSVSIQEAGFIKIDYITVTASSSCLICVDDKDNALYPCIMVSDKRAVEESKYLSSIKLFEDTRRITGLDADPYLLIPKALWIKNNKPDIWNKTFKLLTPNDYLISKLTGSYVIDYINAQKWYCDISTKRYPEQLLNELKIDLKMLPTIVSPGHYVANIRTDIGKSVGILNDAKVIATTYDAICSFIGSGAFREGEAVDVSGTVTVFRCASQKKPDITSTKIQHTAYMEANINIIGGSNNLGGGLIEWVKQCYYNNENIPYELMEKEAADASIGAGGVIFLPYLLGERTPIWDTCARGVFFGLERSHTRKEMTRAVFESTGFIDLDMIMAIEETGVKINSIKVSGGLARIQLISQIKADVTGREIQVLSEFETTASGSAMIALYGQNEFNSLLEAADAFIDVRMIIKPNKKNYSNYQKLYALYKETYDTLKPLFPKRLEVVKQLYGKKQIKVENL